MKHIVARSEPQTVCCTDYLFLGSILTVVSADSISVHLSDFHTKMLHELGQWFQMCSSKDDPAASLKLKAATSLIHVVQNHSLQYTSTVKLSHITPL